MDMTVRAFMIYPFSFLLSGVAIFGSAFFTALNDGLTSAIISFPRTLVFQTAAFRIAYRKKYEYCWKKDRSKRSFFIHFRSGNLAQYLSSSSRSSFICPWVISHSSSAVSSPSMVLGR